MGSPPEEAGRADEEGSLATRWRCRFFMGAYEGPRKQFREVMDYNPSYFKRQRRRAGGVKYRPAGGREWGSWRGRTRASFRWKRLVGGAGGVLREVDAEGHKKPAGWG